MRNATLLFLVKKDGETITEICLPMKKRGFGKGRYNGVGGKVENETIEDATRRETHEEIKVTVKEMQKVGEFAFTFPHKADFNQVVHVYLSDSWEGNPTESEEMKPFWFSTTNIPYSQMWPDDILWLPGVLKGKYATGSFTFGEGDIILEQELTFS
jgi:NADH pyrophosphatase NudC (nudix superfamily)